MSEPRPDPESVKKAKPLADESRARIEANLRRAAKLREDREKEKQASAG